MHWLTRLAMCAVAGGLAGCTEYRQVAIVPVVVEGPVAVPEIETDLFAARVKTFYHRRLAEQPPLPLGNGGSRYTYYERTVTQY